MKPETVLQDALVALLTSGVNELKPAAQKNRLAVSLEILRDIVHDMDPEVLMDCVVEILAAVETVTEHCEHCHRAGTQLAGYLEGIVQCTLKRTEKE